MSQIYIWNKTLHVWDSSSVHHQEFFFFSLYTQQWYMSYRFVDSCRAGSGSSVLILLASCNCDLYDIYQYTIALCTVKTPDDGHRNCPKHVEFYSKNKFEKLVYLVGFIIRKYQGSSVEI